MAFACLFEQEMFEAKQQGKTIADPSTSACIVLVLFILWYGSARRIPQNASQCSLQLERFQRLHDSLQALYPQKDWSFTKKYHNMGHHVHTIGFALGGWELASTNTFEMENKYMKHVAAFHTNRKEYSKQVDCLFDNVSTGRIGCDSASRWQFHSNVRTNVRMNVVQILVRELRQFTADVCDWIMQDRAFDCAYAEVKSRFQKGVSADSDGDTNLESTGFQFPIHELIKRNSLSLCCL